MSFWSANRWRALSEEDRPVVPYDPAHLEGANYLLSVGGEIFVSAPTEGNTVKKFKKKKESFCIDPGQFAFLLTEEQVHVPRNAIGFISIRAGVKFSGLVNISGFHVDPGYSGRLIFAVFNAGPTRIHLRRGDRIFPIWLADLDSEISTPSPNNGYTNIPAKLVNSISGDFTTAYQRKTQIDQLKTDVGELKAFRNYLFLVIGLLLLIFGYSMREALVDMWHSVRTTTNQIDIQSKGD